MCWSEWEAPTCALHGQGPRAAHRGVSTSRSMGHSSTSSGPGMAADGRWGGRPGRVCGPVHAGAAQRGAPIPLCRAFPTGTLHAHNRHLRARRVRRALYRPAHGPVTHLTPGGQSRQRSALPRGPSGRLAGRPAPVPGSVSRKPSSRPSAPPSACAPTIGTYITGINGLVRPGGALWVCSRDLAPQWGPWGPLVWVLLVFNRLRVSVTFVSASQAPSDCTSRQSTVPSTPRSRVAPYVAAAG